MSRKFLSAALVSLGLLTPFASLPAQADTLRNGFSVERLARVDALLESYVNQGRLAGVVALVLRDGKPVYQRAVGWSDKEAGRRMTMDTEFRIASQSKALTSVAILQLMEAGKLTVNDKAGKWIPTFEKTQVSVRNDNGVGTTLVPARRPITIRDLLTHTAGISYGMEPEISALYEAKGLGPATGHGYYFSDKDEPICVTMERLGTLPFVAQPGEEYVYGYNTDILGCIVEKASGMPLDEYIRTHITGPLGMNDTHFFLPVEKRDRFAVVYGSDADGKAVRQPEGQKGQGHYVDGPRKSFSGGAGMVSTARDYATFLEALRNGGALGKVRILSPHAVRLMTTNQVGKLRGENANGFGFGFETHDRYGASGMESVGSWGWGGAYGTYYRVDPEERLTTVFMIQLLPNTTDFRDKFTAAVYQALLQ
ncbi:MAG TPA: serine hydrolase domain-containing protein [Steroidobacteraceae bacterium]|jgi:CubicO group peptidase (beta-lactamase class C family)|nr:serine hydrolase domain-containing protein [Steroidobacteraceae bacterium]